MVAKSPPLSSSATTCRASAWVATRTWAGPYLVFALVLLRHLVIAFANRVFADPTGEGMFEIGLLEDPVLGPHEVLFDLGSVLQTELPRRRRRQA